jgi:hypothetical protein
MRGVSVYIEGQKLDLFDDEQISIKSTQQNVQDISKVFTDFSQSFSVPASVNNNAIFNHFYQNDLTQTIDQNIRRSAFIEIDLTTFREGQISLEKSEVKDNKAHSYQVTFYGNLTSLKDKFGSDKLVDLNYLNSLKHNFTPTEVKSRITDGSTDYKIRYPLIFDRNVTYNDAASTDLNSNDGAVRYNELFPAIKLIQMLAAITSKYGVAFQGSFLSTKRFTNAFLLCQNAESFSFITAPTLANINSLATLPSNNNNALSAADFFDVATETLTLTQFTASQNFPSVSPSGGVYSGSKHTIALNVTSVSSTSVFYYIDVFVDGQHFQTYGAIGTNLLPGAIVVNNGFLVTPREFQFFVRAQSDIDLELQIQYRQSTNYFEDVGLPSNSTLTNTFLGFASFSITAEISVLNYLPDMTVESFFSGLLKMFNLTCYPLAIDTYQLEPIDDWYAKGAVVDITEYTDIKSTQIDRVKLYKNIEFNYQESESATNTIFRDLTNRNYGSANEQFEYDGGEFKIELPFENMQMQKFTGTNLQIGETIKTDGTKYAPKPMILYMYDELAANFKFNEGGSTITSQTDYMPFGQDVIDGNLNYTLNFHPEISTMTLQTEQRTLFAEYYAGYLFNLYNLKNRETKVKTNLPISLLTNLELNDRLIIRDKRYFINDMNCNLTTGEVDFTLLNDFRDVLVDNQNKPIDPIQPSDGAQCVDVRILLPNNAVSAAITTTVSGVTITPSTLTADGSVSVCIPANTDLLKLIITEEGENINTEQFIRLRTEEGEVAVYPLTVTYTFADGSTAANQILIEQQP